MGELTKSQINRAGKTLRHRTRDAAYSDESAIDNAFGVLFDYRATFRAPLASATMGLRSMVRTAHCQAEVSQRLKRLPTILDKLHREPSMALAKMQDIGGCRAVLNSIDEIRRVQRRLSKNRPPVSVSDYIIKPKPSGYRGVHVVVVYDDHCIEVQLRTQSMHAWAFTVEKWGGQINEDLKSGDGPEAVLALFKTISEAMALEEHGGDVDTTMVNRIAELRRVAQPFMTGGSS